MTAARVTEQVHVVGTGLLGTSIALGLRELGVDVTLEDVSPGAVGLAVDYGAGRLLGDTDAPGLVVVAVPPDVTARVVMAQLIAHPDALVTDVASVKAEPLAQLRAAGADVTRYVGSHPMAGRELGGAINARTDLFIGRPWVITAHERIDRRRAATVEQLALDLGAVPTWMDVEAHDAAVALVSHVPQVIASLLAARLVEGTDDAVALAGGGLRDTTRIASADPALWVQILGANAAPIVALLRGFRDELGHVIDALDDVDAPGARRALAEAVASGNTGVARIPGKHGQAKRYRSLVVVVDDRPGQLARLLTDIGDAGVNMEDLRLEHSPGAQVGFAEVSVLPEAEQHLIDELTARGWRISGSDA